MSEKPHYLQSILAQDPTEVATPTVDEMMSAELDIPSLGDPHKAQHVFGIYTHDEAVIEFDYQHRPEVEIVVTRQLDDNYAVIAELSEVRKVLITSGSDEAGIVLYNAAGLSALPDLAITIEGGKVSSSDNCPLSLASRVMLETGRGDSVIVGLLRPQDVVTLSSGTTIADYEVVIDDHTGQLTLIGDESSISFSTTNGLPQFASEDLWVSEPSGTGESTFQWWSPCLDEDNNSEPVLADIDFVDHLNNKPINAECARTSSPPNGHEQTASEFQPGDRIDFYATGEVIGDTQRLTLSAGSALTASGNVAKYSLCDSDETTTMHQDAEGSLSAEGDENVVEPCQYLPSDFN